MNQSVQTLFRLLLAIGLLLFSSEGHVGQIDPVNVDLKDLVLQSETILVVSRADPYLSVTDIPITEKTGVRPYQSVMFRFNIQDVLFNASKNIFSVGSFIEVLGANESTNYDIFKKFHLEGISKSPIYRYYESSESDPTKEKLFIIFLQSHTDDNKKITLHFTVENAYESIKSKSLILSLIKLRE
jgi:hypothetical protein